MKNLKLFFSILIINLFCNNLFSQEIDLSQSPEEAIETGAPSLDKNWLPQDYQNFNTYLEKMDNNALPRLSSAKSKDIFEKVVASVDQPFILNSSYPLNQRFQLVSLLQQEVGKILLKYLSAHYGQNDYSLEISYLMGITLVTSKQMISVINELIPNLDPKSSDYEKKLEGLEMIQEGVTTMLDGVLFSLQEKETYSDQERNILADYLEINGPLLLDFLNESVKEEFQIKLEKFVSEESNEEIKSSISNLISTM